MNLKELLRKLAILSIIIIIFTDVYLFYIINVTLHNPFLDVPMIIITYIGDIVFWIGICILLFVFGGEKGKNVAFMLIIALFIGYFATEILKYIAARPRPFNVLGGVNIVTGMSGYSIPSGHAVTAFTGCTLIGKEYGYLYPLLMVAFLVGFSRIYLGVHYPTDVLVGALLGILFAFIVIRFKDDIIKLRKKLL